MNAITETQMTPLPDPELARLDFSRLMPEKSVDQKFADIERAIRATDIVREWSEAFGIELSSKEQSYLVYSIAANLV